MGKYYIKVRFLRYLVEKNVEYVFFLNFYMIYFFNINNIDVSLSVLFYYESVRLLLFFIFYIVVICCFFRMRFCVYRLRVIEFGGRV